MKFFNIENYLTGCFPFRLGQCTNTRSRFMLLQVFISVFVFFFLPQQFGTFERWICLKVEDCTIMKTQRVIQNVIIFSANNHL